MTLFTGPALPAQARQGALAWALCTSATVASIGFGVATPAAAAPPTSGSGTAQIVQSFPNSSGDNVPLRAGNNKFGEQHIRIGGSHRNAENHELSGFAKQQWQSALNGNLVVGRFPGSAVYSHRYETPGGRDRTMCVVVDTNDFLHAGTNYGYKGIITAFWMPGHQDSNDCNSSPG